ncbi:MAG: endonuclease III [Defluviitaleaceae bacterium]|nr:endonuclease III [Defluviitaleaceae bacterium]
MTKIKKILSYLDEHYPYEDKCYLNYTHDYELLFATILSAQCTDDRVNIVTKTLFVKYPTLEAFANANLSELEQDVLPTGFYRNKAKNLKFSAQILLSEYAGNLPSEVELLTKLPGVGRKTANVVRCHIFKISSVVVDTHVGRISRKLGLTAYEDPVKVEFDLMEKLPESHWIRYNHQLIAHGRLICKARKPMCEKCFMQEVCEFYKKTQKKFYS